MNFNQLDDYAEYADDYNKNYSLVGQIPNKCVIRPALENGNLRRIAKGEVTYLYSRELG